MDKNVLQTQTYGAEARGSLAKSEVIIQTTKYLPRGYKDLKSLKENEI